MLLKQRPSIGVLFVLLLSMILAACRPAGTPAPTRSDPTPAPTHEPVVESPTVPVVEKPASTPEPAGSGLQEYVNENFGFSLSLPDGYEVENSVYYSFVFRAPQGTQGHRERAFLQVELALNQTAEWYANQAKDENANLGTSISVSEIEIDGQKAVILGQMPGQDLNRQVFVVYKGILYHLTFMPDSPQEGEAYQQMVSLYATVLDTLTFLPNRLEVPPVISLSNMTNQLERALESRSEDDVIRPMREEFIVIEWLAPGTTLKSYTFSDAAPVILNSIAQSPDLVFQPNMGWPDVPGGAVQFAGFFPGEEVAPVFVQGWGPQGDDEAMVIIGRWPDGSLYWRGVLVSQGPFTQ